MPLISRFFGIVVMMYHSDHPPPHCHVGYGEYHAAICIEEVTVLEGRLPPRVLGLVVEWVSLHQDELLANWERVQRHEAPARIAPLE